MCDASDINFFQAKAQPEPGVLNKIKIGFLFVRLS